MEDEKVWTGKDLVTFLIENDMLDCEIEIKYRDSGGEYEGSEKLKEIYDFKNQARIITL